MSSETLIEERVQEVAIDWLTKHYQQRQDARAVLGEREVGVRRRSKLGKGIADGLIVAQLADGTVYVASMEAKSAKRLFDILPWYGDEKWLIHALLAGIAGLVLAGLLGWTMGGWFWRWVFPLLVFIVAGFLYLVITYDWSYYRVFNAIAQVKRYPANEQWVALSTDAYDQLGGEHQRSLLEACQKKGVGLVQVGEGELVTLSADARPRRLPRGWKDFLACYTRAESIRRKLQKKVKRGRLPKATPLRHQDGGTHGAGICLRRGCAHPVCLRQEQTWRDLEEAG